MRKVSGSEPFSSGPARPLILLVVTVVVTAVAKSYFEFRVDRKLLRFKVHDSTTIKEVLRRVDFNRSWHDRF